MSTNQTALAPTNHHANGPSTWPARSECAAFTPKPDVDIEDVDGPPEEDTTARGRGVVMHKAVAMLLAGDLEQRQRALDGLSDRERDQVQWVASKAIEIVESHGYRSEDIRCEQRVTMLDPSGDSFEPMYFGTGDGECGPIDFDWKFAELRNYFAQLVGYALPKMEARGEKRRYAFILNGRYRRVERYVLDLATVQSVGYGLLARYANPHKRPTACSYCGFCNNVATCPAITGEPVALVSRRDDWSMKLPTPHASQIHDPAWLGAARFVWKRYLEPWGNAIEFASGNMAAMGAAPAGFKIQKQKGSAVVSDVRKAFCALLETVGDDVLWANVKMPVGSLAKAHADAAGISEAKAKAQIETALIDAGALGHTDGITKLLAEKDAEDRIRAALGRVSALIPAEQIPELDTDRNGAV
jgi:hypothetical protein